MAEDELVRRVEETIAAGRLLAPGDRLIVAVSGGADSTALLYLLHTLRPKYQWQLAAVHVNHGLRPAESAEEERYVKELCMMLEVPCYVSSVDVHSALPAYGNNVQSAARALRFQAFQETAAEFGTSIIALGHHGDDQAETVLMRLLRGTGPGGLAGIRLSNELNGLKLIRPLLRISKEELEAYCARHSLKPRFDSSNASRSYFRNIVRLDILPYLMKFRPGAADSLRRLAELVADEDEFMDSLARERLGSAIFSKGKVRCERAFICKQHPALQRRMIKIILNSLNLNESAIDFAKIEEIREAIAAEQPTTLELRVSSQIVFRRSYDVLEWAPFVDKAPEGYRYEIDVLQPGELLLHSIGGRLEWEAVAVSGGLQEAAINNRCEAWFEVPLSDLPWIVRTRLPGDRMEPLGLNGSKKVKDIFVDGKLPKRLRGEWPILTDSSGRILWVPGFRRAREALLSEGSRIAVKMKFTYSTDFAGCNGEDERA